MRLTLVLCTVFLLLTGLVRAQYYGFSIEEAVELTLQEDPVLKLQDVSVGLTEARLRVAKSSFDFNLNSELRWYRRVEFLLPTNFLSQQFDQLTTRYTSIQIGAAQKFRTGLSVVPGISFSRVRYPIPGNSRFQNTPSINLGVIQPLLKGRGQKSVAALERATRLELRSGTLYSKFLASKEIYSCAVAYWEYVAAWKMLQVYKQNEFRVKHLLAVTQKLVEGQVVPRADLSQIEADVADKSALRISALQRFYESRLELGRIIGLPYEMSLTIDQPQDSFPDIENSGYYSAGYLDWLVDFAVEQRYDIRSVRCLTEANQQLFFGAKRDLAPSLDLRLLGEYGGYAVGNSLGDFFAPLGTKDGTNAAVDVALVFTFPVQNNAAKGRLQEAALNLEQRKIIEENQIRNAKINVRIAIRNLKAAVNSLEKQELSLEKYKTAFKNEQKKYEKGLTTLLNLILFQERLTATNLKYIQSQQVLANAIVNLRHETATLAPEVILPDQIDRDVFYRIPSFK